MPDAIPFATLLRASSAKRPQPVAISGDDLVALPYSPGNTGLPKGAMLTHRSLTTDHLQFTAALRLDCTDVGLLFLPFYHIYGAMLTGGFLAAGATQVLIERFEV